MSNTKTDSSKERGRTWREKYRDWVSGAMALFVASPHDPPKQSDKIGEQPGTIRPAKDAYIEQESVEWLINKLDGPIEATAHVETVHLDTNYGELVFSVEDGHIVIEYVEESTNAE